MASLIIIIKTPELINIDLNSGLYLFGISTVNSNIINENSYQHSNRFDELTPGVYNWAVKHIQTGQIRAKGTDVVKRLFDGGCYSKLVNNIQELNIPLEEHKKDVVCDIECFIEVNNNMFKFIPDTARVNLDNSVTIIASTPFTGKVTIC